jgi:hypothetical protein
MQCGQRKKVMLGLLLLLILLIGIIFRGFIFLRQVVDDKLYDNKNHYLSCRELPEAELVLQVVKDHREEVDQIRNVNPGNVTLWVDTVKCPGKAEIVIEYPGHGDRLKIEALINGDRFFVIPYRLVNT